MPTVKNHEKFEGVFNVELEDGSIEIATKSLAKGITVYDEKIVKFENEEYRIWNPYRSKLAAAIKKGLKILPIKRGTKVLYLGSATGTTVSHVSDIVQNEGVVYSVEFATRVMREFIERCAKHRMNVIPILADARKPEKYLNILEPVDVIYLDIAQPEQAKVLFDNAKLYLKKGGMCLFFIKAMSIDATANPEEIFRKEKSFLIQKGFEIVEEMRLEPFDKDHEMVLCSK
jgi:rRNA 2''-O-methyltransferase fibrillarin (EC 2.1.1.-)